MQKGLGFHPNTFFQNNSQFWFTVATVNIVLLIGLHLCENIPAPPFKVKHLYLYSDHQIVSQWVEFISDGA